MTSKSVMEVGSTGWPAGGTAAQSLSCKVNEVVSLTIPCTKLTNMVHEWSPQLQHTVADQILETG